MEDLDIKGLFLKHRPGCGEGGGLRCACDRCPPDTGCVEVYKILPGGATYLPAIVCLEFAGECPTLKLDRGKGINR
jgi:hypothetical protein